MPRYHFDTHIGPDVLADPAGTELHDPDHAWEVARATIAAMLREPGASGRLAGACLVVTDADREIVFEFPFAELLSPPPRRDGGAH